ncbi:anaerobic ribonucleoside-triphosphate reductase activating protein [Brachybacterium muris]|uniref:Radical SAM protein n=1 Tax=Brachybacterium muris UCD-AY4 TaxID=1249481 RepID=A0A022KYS9_9MICO|nr:anaerobic ribonucleoside-triphosphate reductase activating protein [Brachybacterium muris]EYT50994.1 radical SAM protein [Brachybacterium muris UCD-AY4]
MSPVATLAAPDLRIAGLVPLSSVDWPDHLVATVFCQGCPWRCTYCHNTAILDPHAPGTVEFAALESLLDRRRGLLDGVVFSGGEATMQHALVPAARAVRERGYRVGLHTGGAFPTRLQALLGVDGSGHRTSAPVVDWVGFDVKAAPGGYTSLVGRSGAWQRSETSLRLLLASRVDHELRMTVTPQLIDQVPTVIETVGRAGGTHLVLQKARADGADSGFATQLAAVPDWAERFDAAAHRTRQLGAQQGLEVTVRA